MVPPTVTRGDLYVRGEISSEDRLALARVGLETLDQIDTALVTGELRELVRERGTGIGAGLYRHVLYARTRIRMQAPVPPGRPGLPCRVQVATGQREWTWLVSESLQLGCTRAELARRSIAQLAALRAAEKPARWRALVLDLRTGPARRDKLDVRLPHWLAAKAEAIAAEIGACTTEDVIRLAVQQAREHPELRQTLRSAPQFIEALVLSAIQPLGAA